MLIFGRLYQQFRPLSALSSKTEEHIYTMDYPNVESPSLDKPFIDIKRIIAYKSRQYYGFPDFCNMIRSVFCLNDEIKWTCSEDRVMREYNLMEKLVKSVKIKSGYSQEDIVVTKTGVCFILIKLI